MRKILLSFGVLFGLSVNAQDCSELFISEYLEGLATNKALEIYNPTNETVDLANYFVVRYNNGNATPIVQNAIQLKGTLAPYSVHVGVLDKRDPDGEGQEAPVWDDLAEKADEWYCPDYDESNTFYWNGNDAVALFKGKIPAGTPLAMPISSLDNVQLIDLFGKVGEDPGDGWTLDGTPVADGGVVVTKDYFLVRKPSVTKGNTTNPSVFKPQEEWDTLSFFVYVLDDNGDTIYNNQGNPARRMNVDNLGIHDCECNALSVSEYEMETVSFNVYPNPVTGKQINFQTTDKIEEITIVDALGKTIKHINKPKSFMTIDLNVSQGLYFITAKGKNNASQTKKFIVK